MSYCSQATFTRMIGVPVAGDVEEADVVDGIFELLGKFLFSVGLVEF